MLYCSTRSSSRSSTLVSSSLFLQKTRNSPRIFARAGCAITSILALSRSSFTKRVKCSEQLVHLRGGSSETAYLANHGGGAPLFSIYG
ncbi:hypothetical protein SePPVgORF069 [Seal parapoxvirus]|uniref:Uncharacterized protein n=1 Tax=Seal parapoxvirus TaxID=187984 RepID=A0A1Z4CGE5_9POXV|nr:hypothetical protein CGV03_gp069 [Seal parapoxvirus]ASF89971.1 hypothetical protein SePPVgORF069 [Seal parapoxvirus]